METNYEEEVRYYQRALRHPTIGTPARSYALQRGLDEATWDAWELGWAPPRGIPPNYRNTQTKVYTKLWGRLTIPVRDQHGRIVTISGRTVYSGITPKYDMYAAQGFSARKVLFGLWQNYPAITHDNMAIITEGQLDVISAWQHGLRCVTSSFGAHCSVEHLTLLARWVDQVYVIYDGDWAGNQGLKAATDLTKRVGDLQVTPISPFPRGDDLDSWLRTHSTDELVRALKNY